MLNVHSLTCLRNKQLLFSNLNFNLASSEILHVMGANGSGKTSLLQIVVGLLKPYQGEIYWKNVSVMTCDADYRANLIYLGHRTGIKDGLTALENLKMAVKLSQKTSKRLNYQSVLERVGLEKFSHVLSQHLSAGQRQRLALARLLLVEASLWVLDEPFTSLDNEAATLLKTLLQEHVARGGISVLTSHQELNLTEVKKLLL